MIWAGVSAGYLLPDVRTAVARELKRCPRGSIPAVDGLVSVLHDGGISEARAHSAIVDLTRVTVLHSSVAYERTRKIVHLRNAVMALEEGARSERGRWDVGLTAETCREASDWLEHALRVALAPAPFAYFVSTVRNTIAHRVPAWALRPPSRGDPNRCEQWLSSADWATRMVDDSGETDRCFVPELQAWFAEEMQTRKRKREEAREADRSNNAEESEAAPVVAPGRPSQSHSNDRSGRSKASDQATAVRIDDVPPRPDAPLVLHFVRSGFTSVGLVSVEGMQLTFHPGSEKWALTIDPATGRSWATFSEEEQRQAYGDVFFRPGPSSIAIAEEWRDSMVKDDLDLTTWDKWRRSPK